MSVENCSRRLIHGKINCINKLEAVVEQQQPQTQQQLCAEQQPPVQQQSLAQQPLEQTMQPTESQLHS